MNELTAKGRRLMELRKVKDEAKAAATNASKDYKEAEEELFLFLDESDFEGAVKLNLGPPWGVVSFSPRETTFARVLDPREAAAHFTATEEIDAVLEPKLAEGKMNEIVRDCLDEHRPLPPGLDFTTRRGVTVTQQDK